MVQNHLPTDLIYFLFRQLVKRTAIESVLVLPFFKCNHYVFFFVCVYEIFAGL